MFPQGIEFLPLKRSHRIERVAASMIPRPCCRGDKKANYRPTCLGATGTTRAPCAPSTGNVTAHEPREVHKLATVLRTRTTKPAHQPPLFCWMCGFILFTKSCSSVHFSFFFSPTARLVIIKSSKVTLSILVDYDTLLVCSYSYR